MLGSNYPGNLCELSPDERRAIEDDKQRWFKAYQAAHQLTPPQIKQELSKIECAIEREDMQRRTRVMYKRYRMR